MDTSICSCVQVRTGNSGDPFVQCRVVFLLPVQNNLWHGQRTIRECLPLMTGKWAACRAFSDALWSVLHTQRFAVSAWLTCASSYYTPSTVGC
jgi:hypothetical protein